MANYTLANYVKAQMFLQNEFAANDQRFRNPVVFKTFLNNPERFFPDYKQLKKAVNRPLEANYFKRTAQTLSTAGISDNHTGTGGDSGTLTPAFTPYSNTFSMTLKQANNSIYDWQEEFNDNMRNKIIDFADGLDAAAGQYLFDNRTGVNTAAVKGTFNATNNAYEVASANASEIGTLIKTVLDLNKYQDHEIDVTCDSYLFTEITKLANQGAGNATNTSFQFLGLNFIHDANMHARAIGLDATYNKGFGIAVPRGHIAFLDWIPVQNRQGVETKVNIYSSILNPVDGLQYGGHSYQTRADGTAVNGQTQDVLFQHQLFLYGSFNHAPSSVANETPNFAFAIK